MSVPAIPPLGLDNAAAFRCRKADVVTVGQTTTVTQLGATYVRGPELPDWPEPTMRDDAVIETFLADSAGEITALGANHAFNGAWLPLVERFARVVLGEAEQVGIEFVWPAYVTASTTPSASLEGRAHLDDDQFVADEGVGLVAIYGAEQGPHVACGQVEFAPMTSNPGQLTVTDDHIQAFADGTIAVQQAAPDRIVVFPQFGQLHAGPVFDGAEPGDCRGLLVLRVQTNPNLYAPEFSAD